ncbi:hypothetical protein GQ55_5G171600 [Panicum hallii var. hallii]|uniref:Uncharacterized protein n=1 Tax=Panicum hallii var. hallii TaxID=1504633 RepID=A0A2T7DH66_9POAL|nr:hypothetical protein GQ55_5G171600 [Panicum hallii var. hallii]
MQRHGRTLLALCLLPCFASCQGRASPEMLGGGMAVRFEADRGPAAARSAWPGCGEPRATLRFLLRVELIRGLVAEAELRDSGVEDGGGGGSRAGRSEPRPGGYLKLIRG